MSRPLRVVRDDPHAAERAALLAGISAALRERDMRAVSALLHRLAVTHPNDARLIVDTIEATA